MPYGNPYKPCKYHILFEEDFKNKSYSTYGDYNMYDELHKKNTLKGRRVKAIACYSSSTGKHLADRVYKTDRRSRGKRR